RRLFSKVSKSGLGLTSFNFFRKSLRISTEDLLFFTYFLAKKPVKTMDIMNEKIKQKFIIWPLLCRLKSITKYSIMVATKKNHIPTN
ncbi:hypothetical protein ABWL48_18130, partial [Streptococcus suis]